MAEEPVNAIREANRHKLFFDRKKIRDDEADGHRSLENLRVSQETVLNIANKLKTKSAVTAAELKILKNALVDDENYIQMVLSIHGALRGIIRELTGHDVSKQIEAAGCCCNIALGDTKACETLTKAAGHYLVASLESLSNELAVACAWTVGNLAGSGPKACLMLLAQGAISGLTKMATFPNEEVKVAAVETLIHLTCHMKDNLREEHLYTIIKSLPQEMSTTELHLLFILSCHKDFTVQLFTEQHLLKILENFYISIDDYISNKKNMEKLMYLIRILANCNNENVYRVVLNRFLSSDMCGSVRLLLDSDVSESLMWLLGNILNCCGDHEFFAYLR